MVSMGSGHVTDRWGKCLRVVSKSADVKGWGEIPAVMQFNIILKYRSPRRPGVTVVLCPASWSTGQSKLRIRKKIIKK